MLDDRGAGGAGCTGCMGCAGGATGGTGTGAGAKKLSEPPVTLKVPRSRYMEFPTMSCALTLTGYSPLAMPDTGNVHETLYVAFMASPDTRFNV